MEMPSAIKKEAGFTLIETCIAMVVMFVAILGTVSVFAIAIGNNSGANDRELAMAVGQQALEQYRSVPFTDSSLNATSGTTTTITRSGRQYSLTTSIVHSNTINGQPTVKTITVQVTPLGSNFGSVLLTTVRTTNLAGPYRF